MFYVLEHVAELVQRYDHYAYQSLLSING